MFRHKLCLCVVSQIPSPAVQLHGVCMHGVGVCDMCVALVCVCVMCDGCVTVCHV